jgi:hypothetical protein
VPRNSEAMKGLATSANTVVPEYGIGVVAPRAPVMQRLHPNAVGTVQSKVLTCCFSHTAMYRGNDITLR